VNDELLLVVMPAQAGIQWFFWNDGFADAEQAQQLQNQLTARLLPATVSSAD